MESGFYTTTSSVVGLRRNSKALPKAKFAPKKGSWSLFGGLLPVWSTTAFWIPANPLHLRSMLSKLMRCTKNFNACSQHWSTERAQFFSTTMPNHMLHNQWFQSRMNWATKFCLISHIHLTSSQPMTISSSISTTFLQGKHFYTQQEAENVFPEFVKSWSMDFYTSRINLFLTGKNVLIVMIPILINKDVFEPSMMI